MTIAVRTVPHKRLVKSVASTNGVKNQPRRVQAVSNTCAHLENFDRHLASGQTSGVAPVPDGTAQDGLIDGALLTTANESSSTTPPLTRAGQRMPRPWGWSQTTDRGKRFRVNRMMVQPGERLLLQMHYNRAEHWVILQGTAEITIGGEHRTLFENQSVYIAVAVRHQLYNPGKIPLELIQVQTGAYLEDDGTEYLDDPAT